MDVLTYNRAAWANEVKNGNIWTVPVSAEEVAAARQGRWQIVLTPTKAVPAEWFPKLKGCDVLCLASGGGQQAPIMAAAGANVTVLDNCPAQLESDRMVAERDGLAIRTVQGDMAHLDMFADESFDLIIHPVSNSFVPDVKPVWKEAYRVLRRGGVMLSGFMNPAIFVFDIQKLDEGLLEVKYKLPYSELESLSKTELEQYMAKQEPLTFSHTLEDQIGGQIAAGFAIEGLYEDISPNDVTSQYMPTCMATKAVKRK